MSRNRLKSIFRPLFTVGPATLYVVVLFAIPMLVFLVYSFWQLEGWEIVHNWTLANYIEVVSNPTYLKLILRSTGVGLITACITVLISFPVAYAMVFKMEKEREIILMLILLSLFSSYLVRVYAWKTILGNSGVINQVLLRIGLINEPIEWLIYSQFAVIITLTSIFIPIAILPIFSGLSNIHPNLLEASRDLGAGSFQTFRKVTLPLGMPGIISGFIFTFILTAGDYITPSLLGGKTGQMIGNSIIRQFGVLSNWPLGSAITFFVTTIYVALFYFAFILIKNANNLKR